MLTVWTICWGDRYSHDYVRHLQNMVREHLSERHWFLCISDQQIDGVTTVLPAVDFPGWWQKIGLFHPYISEERNLWLDLDVIVTGSLDELVQPITCLANMRVAKNWAQSGHGGCQSSVMYWEGNDAQGVYSWFDASMAHWPPVNRPGTLWGDQEWITRLRDEGELTVEYFREPHVRSYKYHCRAGVPEDTRVVVFHGKPDPHEVNEPWVRRAHPQPVL